MRLNWTIRTPWGRGHRRPGTCLQFKTETVQVRQAGQFSQGVHAYLTQTPPGRPGYSPGAHASGESETVENSTNFCSLRMFSCSRCGKLRRRGLHGSPFPYRQEGPHLPEDALLRRRGEDRQGLRRIHREAPAEQADQLDGPVMTWRAGRCFWCRRCWSSGRPGVHLVNGPGAGRERERDAARQPVSAAIARAAGGAVLAGSALRWLSSWTGVTVGS